MHKGLFAAVTSSICLVAAAIAEGQERAGPQPRAAHLAESVALADYGGDWYTDATAINNRGRIAGWAARGDQWVAFVWSPGEGYVDIAQRAFPRDINNRGDVVGVLSRCDEGDCRLEGFFWSADGGLLNLSSFVPFAINEDGDMAGVCQPEWQACVMRGGALAVIAGPGSEARSINVTGDVVGLYGDNRGFQLSAEGQFTDIGRAVASDLNDHGVIAGHRWTVMSGGSERAMVTAWTKEGPVSPALEVGVAIGLNKKAWVIAYGFDENERYFTYIWNPGTNVKVMLDSADGGYVQLSDINDHGDVVGRAGQHAAIWRVRQRDLAADRALRPR
jgi:hypothetical protein